LVLAAVNCGKTEEKAADAGSNVPQTPAAPSHGVQIVAGPYTVPAGTEKYFCYTKTLAEPSEVAAIAFTPFAGQAVHHLAVFRTLAREPEGYSECPVLVKSSWVPLYAGGVGTNGLTLPTEAAFKFAGNTQILVQLHLVNASPSEVTDTTYMNVDTAVDASTRQPASIFALGSQNFTVPTGMADYTVTKGCQLTIANDLNVFAVFPHMHQIGTKLVFEHGATEAAATEKYKIDPWVFGNQPMEPFNMVLKAGEYARATCHFNNTTGHDVTFGESSANEMCYLVFFAYPTNVLDGCIDF
jgi:hypothetical protein